MQIKEFLALLGTGKKINYFVECSDLLGISLLLPRVLEKHMAKDDVHFFDAATLTKEKARQLEKDARKAPVGSSAHSYYVITSLHQLPEQSVGPLLKAVEEAKYAAFIFQAQYVKRETRTLLSRSMLVKLPFMSKKVVLANMQALHYDATAADQLNLYDGNLSGTIRAVSMKDSMMAIRRDLKLGLRGVEGLMSDDVIGSLAFVPAIEPQLTDRERRFLAREDGPDRRRMLAYLLAERSVR